MKTETIAAIATSLSESGISIIRISGNQSLNVADKMIITKNGKKVSDFKSHTIHYGHVMDGDIVVDEVMVSFMKAPNSFTAENTVEINCHGGVLVTKKILQLALKNGARLAEPGEFTKRAFLNGRIDLSKAEAIMDIIHADNEFALQIGMKQLKGSLSKKVYSMREELIYEIAFIESALDDPEHYSLEGYSEKLKEKIIVILNNLIKMEESAENGKIIRQGINTVIVGKPNAGKSSFLNFLLGEDKAIVTDIAGTTRDALEDYIRIQDISFHIIDTAGIRKTEDVVEKIGVERSLKAAKEAELVLLVLDGSQPLTSEDEELMELTKDMNRIILINKIDVDNVLDIEGIEISAKEGNIQPLEDKIIELFEIGNLKVNDEVYLSNIRHIQLMEHCLQSVQKARQAMDDLIPVDLIVLDLYEAWHDLKEILGQEAKADLLDELFSRFCIGK